MTQAHLRRPAPGWKAHALSHPTPLHTPHTQNKFHTCPKSHMGTGPKAQTHSLMHMPPRCKHTVTRGDRLLCWVAGTSYTSARAQTVSHPHANMCEESRARGLSTKLWSLAGANTVTYGARLRCTRRWNDERTESHRHAHMLTGKLIRACHTPRLRLPRPAREAWGGCCRTW